MNVINFLILAIVSYLLGGFNSAIVVSKTLAGFDLREHGSGNAGLTNAFRTLGGKKALLVLLGDILKGVIAVMLGFYLMGDIGKLLAGVFVVIGHVYPIYFGFRGGKGVLTGATMVAIFDWRIFLVIFAVFVVTVAITKYISLGSMLAAIVFPIMTQILYQNLEMTGISAFLALGVVILHRGNIGRLIKGNENKFTFKPKKVDADKKENSK